MTDFYSTPVARSPAARRHRRKKQVAHLSLMAAVLGWLGVVLSGGLFLLSRLYNQDVQHRFLLMSVVYLAGGLLCLVVHKGLKYLGVRMRKAGRPQTGLAPFDAHRHRRGGALILVLGVVAVVALLVAHAQTRSAMQRRQNERALRHARLQAAATEAVFFALRQLADDEDPMCDHTNEAWCVRKEWKDPAGVSVRLHVADENRFFDVNNLVAQPSGTSRAPADVVADLMTLCGDFAPENRIAALVDWMDAGEDGVFENAFYAKKGQPPPANRVLYTWLEWLTVEGFDRDYFRHRERTSIYEPFKADPLLVFTVLPVNRRGPMCVNVNTASATVLTGLLGLQHEDTVATLVATRNKRPFRSVDELKWVAPDVLKTVGDYLDVRSRFFAVHAQAYADDRVAAVFALAERTAEGEIVVRHWVMM